MHARSATLPDAFGIEQLIQIHVGDGTLLPRSLAEICENIRDFVVVENDGEIVGCGALHLYGMHLAEIRSITVTSKAKGRGAGRILVDALLQEAEHQSVTCVCLFTRIPDFFGQMGFLVVEKEALPDKLHKDCLKCPRLHACDETAMYLGTLPKRVPGAISARMAPEFVQIAQG
jgi:amino-acid N-acetyltransferase